MRRLTVAALMTIGLAAHAQGPATEDTLPGAPENRSSIGGQTGGPPGTTPADIAIPGLWDRPNLVPDIGGIRSRLAAHGITINIGETSEVLGNATGGTRRGAVYEGLTQLGLVLDTGKAGAWSGGTVNVSALQIHGRGLSLNNLGNNLQTVSSIEAERGLLLFELWYEQALFGAALQVRVGQMAADQEFMVTQYGGLFMNHTFGWSTLPSTALPSGGPAYPLATPGIRLRWSARDDLTLLAAVFNGDPAGPDTVSGGSTPQSRNPSGTAFRLCCSVFAIAEAQYALNGGEGAAGLPGSYKLGAWYSSDRFADERRTAGGLSLADPAAALSPGRARRGNWSVYAVADQLVWRRAGEKDGGIGVFARIMGVPGDRNLVNAAIEAGITWKGAFPSRPSDTAGVAVGYARIGDTAAKLDADVAAFTGTFYPVRRHETVLELTYQAQIAPWLQVQPTAQYIFNPRGGVPDPQNPARRLGDAAVLGVRTAITF